MKSCPYTVLKRNKRSYMLMLLCDVYGLDQEELAQLCQTQVWRINELYSNLKDRQIKLYLAHLAATPGQPDAETLRRERDDANECYMDVRYICGYFEKKYPDILARYRDGEPGMSQAFLDKLPPLRPVLSQEDIDRAFALFETRADFQDVAEALDITTARVRLLFLDYGHMCFQAMAP